MEGGWKYTDLAVADSREGVVLQLEVRRGANNASQWKIEMLGNVIQGLGFSQII